MPLNFGHALLAHLVFKHSTPARMDIVSYVVIAIGGLLLAFAGLHGFPSKYVTITVFGIGACLLVIGGCLYWADALSKREMEGRKPAPPPERPWLSVDIFSDGPITFRKDHESETWVQADIPVKYRVTNTGDSPANNVRMQFELCFPASNGGEPVKRQREIANRPSAMSIPFGSGVVFPGVPVEMEMNHIVDFNQMMENALPPEKIRKAGDATFITPYIVGCISYTFGQPDALFTGETGFVYDIYAHGIDSPRAMLMLKIGENLPQERLVVAKYRFGGDYAK